VAIETSSRRRAARASELIAVAIPAMPALATPRPAAAAAPHGPSRAMTPPNLPSTPVACPARSPRSRICTPRSAMRCLIWRCWAVARAYASDDRDRERISRRSRCASRRSRACAWASRSSSCAARRADVGSDCATWPPMETTARSCRPDVMRSVYHRRTRAVARSSATSSPVVMASVSEIVATPSMARRAIVSRYRAASAAL